jgi:hypothetical protein
MKAGTFTKTALLRNASSIVRFPERGSGRRTMGTMA